MITRIVLIEVSLIRIGGQPDAQHQLATARFVPFWIVGENDVC
jgi:hypothetical protein